MRWVSFVLLPVSEGLSQAQAFTVGKRTGPLIPRTLRGEGEKNGITHILFLNCRDNAAHVATPRSSGKSFPLFQ